MTRLLPLALLALPMLAACGGTDPRYLMAPAPEPAAAATARLRVASLEIREVSLPAYAEESQILIEDDKGALTPVDGALWADEPMRAMTLILADQIGAGGRATVAAEPWPLETPAQAAVHVRVSEMVARSSGRFDLKGQFAISSYDRIVRERIEGFAISVPLTDQSPAGIAAASGQALRQLSARIVAELS